MEGEADGHSRSTCARSASSSSRSETPRPPSAHLSRAVEIAESFGIREPGVYRVHADLIEALDRRRGELERAEAVLASVERAEPGEPCSVVARDRRALPRAAARRSRRARGGRALVRRRRSRSTTRLPMPFERARTLLALGLLQRRRNERRRAQESLAEALAIFEELGAPLWAARARRELRPLGGRPTSALALDAGRAARRRAGGERPDQPRGRGRALHQPEDRRVEPRPRLPKARDPLARRARRAHRRQPTDLRRSGGGEIRTHEPLRASGFQDRPVRPLRHPAAHALYRTSGDRRLPGGLATGAGGETSFTEVWPLGRPSPFLTTARLSGVGPTETGLR